MTTNPDQEEFNVSPPQRVPDWASIAGLIFAFGLIFVGIAIGNSDAGFLNIPSVIIVVFGTFAVTSVSFTVAELSKVGSIVGSSLFQLKRNPSAMATQLVDLAFLAKKKGILALSSLEPELKKDPLLYKSVQSVVDGYNGDDIERLLSQEIDAVIDRHQRAASILRRASEVAPAMGLIGTLIGLVQMLADLKNPENIGPAMAVALLTTFYGAILGTIVFAPLAAKLERNSSEEVLIRTLIKTALVSIARQDNPRRLELLLNSDLPPSQQINYFKL